MDELYDNLDNYEDLNIIEQLKTENIELKSKLEEYTIAMDKLQKDFDRVSSDFKKMEMNYSSLLKTAKLEIEKKTKIIKDLNLEKDMIVLKALQNKNHIRSLRDITKPFQKGPMKDGNFGIKGIPPPTENPKPICDTETSVRKEENRLSSVDTVTSSNTDITGRLLKLSRSNPESVELWSDRTSDTKENMAKKHVEDNSSTNTEALSIRNRRKSMPAVRSQAKFSSDEECEETYCRNEPYKKSFPIREENSRQNVDKLYNDRYRHKGLEERNKVSETSSVDDRYSGYEPNRDTYHRNRTDKYATDKHRPRDRYDNTQRHRRYLSPDRSRRATRAEDYYQRQEYGRRRFLESPPPDKFHHYKQRNRESRSKHERDDPFDCDRRDRQQDKYSSKHKIISDSYEEPNSKRQRTDSFNKYCEEEKRWIRNKGVPLEKTVSDLLEEMPQYTTCQSPDDYLLSDDSIPHPIKEIMNTASTPLEDPRPQSKNYILKTVDNRAELSTVTGRNVDLEMVDLSKWDLNQVDIPKALTEKPSQSSSELVSEIYMDIDNPVSNMSAESGEILTCNEDEPDDKDVNRKDKSECSIEKPDAKTPNDDIDKSEKTTKDSEIISTYRIPKIKNKHQDKANILGISIHNSERNDPLNKDKNIADDRNRSFTTTKSKPDVVDKNNAHKVKLKDHKDIDPTKSKVTKDKICHNSVKDERRRKEIAAAKAIIAGDLELSDETCDNMEIPDEVVSNNSINLTRNLQNVKGENDGKSIVENKVLELKITNKDSLDNSETKKINTTKDDSKKPRGKKNSSRVKETDKLNEVVQAPDKKEKVKKDKKAKFSELFGVDSNSVLTPEDFGNDSLITPDDLGIAIDSHAQKPSTTKYLPICEDAQDAVDVNVSDPVNRTTLALSNKLEINDVKEINESQSSKSEKPSKTKSKFVNESKRKKQRKSESELIVSANDPPPQTQSCQNLVTQCSTVEKPVTVISPTELPSQPTAVLPEINKTQQEPVDKLSVAKNMLLKPDGLLKALATSTPQKVLVTSTDSGTKSASVEPNTSVNEHVESVDGASVDAVSAAESMDAQADVDVPDVRIFVKRRRRVIKKPS